MCNADSSVSLHADEVAVVLKRGSFALQSSDAPTGPVSFAVPRSR